MTQSTNRSLQEAINELSAGKLGSSVCGKCRGEKSVDCPQCRGSGLEPKCGKDAAGAAVELVTK